jgi:hypothetical protein
VIRLRVRLIGPNVDDALKGLYLKIDDLGTFYRRWFIPQYLKDVQKNFATEGGLVGGWAPLSPEYNRWKMQQYPGKLVNYLTGKLQRSMGEKGRSRFLSVEIQRRQASITNTLPHAGWVQAQRPFMIPPSMLDSRVYSGLLNQYLEDVLRQTGLRGGRGQATPPAATPVSAFGPSFFDAPSRWTPEHFRRWPEGPGSRDTSRSQKTREGDEDDEE